MATVKIQGNASGSGSVTLSSPSTNSSRTLTLPDRDGSFGFNFLGTISTSSGSSATLSGLDLTSYTHLYYLVDGVGLNTTNDDLCIESASFNYAIGRLTTGGGSFLMYLDGFVDLVNGVSISNVTSVYTQAGAQAATNTNYAGGRPSGYTTSSTSISFLCRSGTFFAGSIHVWGV